MTAFRQLAPSLRTLILAPWLLIAAAVALGSTPAFRQILIDATNAPTTDISLSSAHWTGTLDNARLSDLVPLLDPSYDLNLPHGLSVGGNLSADADGNLSMNGNLFVGSILIAQAVQFPDGSTLYVGRDTLIWTDPNGVAHDLASY